YRLSMFATGLSVTQACPGTLQTLVFDERVLEGIHKKPHFHHSSQPRREMCAGIIAGSALPERGCSVLLTRLLPPESSIVQKRASRCRSQCPPYKTNHIPRVCYLKAGGREIATY